MPTPQSPDPAAGAMTAPPRDPDRAAAEAALAAEGSERMTLPERHVELHPGRHGGARHAEQGNCSCGFPAREGKRKCQFCVDYIKGYRDKHSAAGLCRGHGNPVLPGRKSCPRCVERYRKVNAKRKRLTDSAESADSVSDSARESVVTYTKERATA